MVHPNILRPIGILDLEAEYGIIYPFCEHGALDEAIWDGMRFDYSLIVSGTIWSMLSNLTIIPHYIQCRQIGLAVKWLHSHQSPVLHNDIRAVSCIFGIQYSS